MFPLMIHLPTSYGELRTWAATDAPALVKYANDRHTVST